MGRHARRGGQEAIKQYTGNRCHQRSGQGCACNCIDRQTKQRHAERRDDGASSDAIDYADYADNQGEGVCTDKCLTEQY